MFLPGLALFPLGGDEVFVLEKLVKFVVAQGDVFDQVVGLVGGVGALDARQVVRESVDVVPELVHEVPRHVVPAPSLGALHIADRTLVEAHLGPLVLVLLNLGRHQLLVIQELVQDLVTQGNVDGHVLQLVTLVGTQVALERVLEGVDDVVQFFVVASLVTNPILFCWLFTINYWCQEVQLLSQSGFASVVINGVLGPLHSPQHT